MEKKEMTLEEEFGVRQTAYKEVFEIVDSLNETIDFYYKKSWFNSTHNMTDGSVRDTIMEILKKEMWNLAQRFFQLTKMTENCLVPVGRDDPTVKIAPYTLKANNNFTPTNYGGNVLKNEYELRKVYEQMFMEMVKYCNQFLGMEDKIPELFDQLMQRYLKENERQLNYYIEDIDNAKEAKAELRRDFKEKPAVKYWLKSGHDITKTILEMRKAGCVESDLLPLLEFIAKYERLDKVKKSRRKPKNVTMRDNNGLVAENVNVGLSRENFEQLVDIAMNKYKLSDGSND